ncbi:MAG: hypothetical protein DME85_09690 [Verrucomicrobia bacterium]|nr:MAG: hypothetical protein DME85_09690 [Verrucomicrobiota bacterium]
MKSKTRVCTVAWKLHGKFFSTIFVVVALLAAPTLTNAQSSRLHKPTPRHLKVRVDDAASPQAEAEVQPSNEAVEPTSGPVISPFLLVKPFTVTDPAWTAIGPAPIPNGQTEPADVNGISLTQSPVSGRVTAIVIDPADPNTAYVGTAQGGVYQTTDGGATWTPLMDSADTLAIGSLELDPTDATGNTLLVGSGEGNFCADCYAGFGVYKITGLKTSPVLSGPFGSSQFVHRSIPGLAIDPNNHNNVYVGSATGQQGIGPQPPTGAPARGLFRSTNFFSGSPTFTKLALANLPATADFRVTSIVYEPGSSDRVFVGIADANVPNQFGGIYFTTNASAPTPTFTKVLKTNKKDFAPVKFAINKIGNTVTVVAVTGETAPNNQGQGEAYKAVYDSSKNIINPTFTALPAANGFAAGQGFYNLGAAIDPTNANNIYIVGTLGETFLFSRNGGMTFTPSNDRLHVDSHAVAVAPSNPSIIYTGNDGGIWRSTNAGLTWVHDLNSATFSATQFESVAVHPTDPNFSIGGTQDNGTNFFKPDRTWSRVDFGDGGYALIDQTATDTEDVTMYHTYFNVPGVLIGFGRVLKTSCATEDQWSFKGAYPPPIIPTVRCDGTTDTFNGISLSDPVNFYAPMALGPVVSLTAPFTGKSGQTVYFGTNKLYRSTNKGDSMTVVSQVFPSIVSAIGISNSDDNVRIVGLNNGKVFATVTGGNPLIDITASASTGTPGAMPAKYLARAVIDPNDANTAYVVFNGNAILGKHIWKTTNLNNTGTSSVTWTAIDVSPFGDVSVNAFVVDRANSSHLYAGTDRGVYYSPDGGASWSLYGGGLPDVAVFDLAISSDRHLRAATHGRGFYEIVTAAP